MPKVNPFNDNLYLFDEEVIYSHAKEIFEHSELYKLYRALPLDELGRLLPQKKSEVGAPRWFSNTGIIAVMFLKHYLGLSDVKLIDRINSDWELRFFCGLPLRFTCRIKDRNIISRLRLFVAQHLDIEKFQKVLAKDWELCMEDRHVMLCDATVYESYVKYPTNVKLLWDCNKWVFEAIEGLSTAMRARRPRSRYKDQCRKQRQYEKRKRKTYKQARRRKRALLYLLNKGLGQLQHLLDTHIDIHQHLDNTFYSHLKTIKQIRFQQQYLYDNEGARITGKIVSLFKPYVRTIIRGKEAKAAEYGAKVQVSQCDGINFIDHLDFEPFNESRYLKKSVRNHRERFGKCSKVSADKIYATNKNRKWLKQQHIHHNFVPKGIMKAAHVQQQKQLSRLLSQRRNTVMEGSFGDEKNHYGLRKVLARTAPTEIAWIFFGMMTANAVRIGNRMAEKSPRSKVA